MAKSGFDWHAAPLSPDAIVIDRYRTTQNVRRFVHAFVPGFAFSCPFMAWIRNDTGITLGQFVASAQRRASEK